MSCPQSRGATMNVRYRVELSQAEREQLTEMLSGGRHAARKLKRAQILLAADGGMSDAVIAAGVGVGESTVINGDLIHIDESHAEIGGEWTQGASRTGARWARQCCFV